MGQAWIGIAAPFDHCHLAVLVQPLEADQRRMEPRLIADRDRIFPANSDPRANPVVFVVAVRHDRIEAIVAAGQLHDDENPFRIRSSLAVKSVRGQRVRRVLEEGGQAEANAKSVQSLTQEITAARILG